MRCHICQKPTGDLFWKALIPLVSDWPEAERIRTLTDYGINTQFSHFGKLPEWTIVCDDCQGRYFYFLSLEIL